MINPKTPVKDLDEQEFLLALATFEVLQLHWIRVGGLIDSPLHDHTVAMLGKYREALTSAEDLRMLDELAKELERLIPIPVTLTKGM